MTDTPEPPMVVWLQNQQSLQEGQWQDDDVTWCRDKIFKHDVGPYVHLDQFLAEAKKRSKKRDIFLPIIIEEMTKELKEK